MKTTEILLQFTNIFQYIVHELRNMPHNIPLKAFTGDSPESLYLVPGPHHIDSIPNDHAAKADDNSCMGVPACAMPPSGLSVIT